MTYPDHLIDKRVIDRNIVKGLVDQKEHAKLLAQLPDVADNAEVMDLSEIVEESTEATDTDEE